MRRWAAYAALGLVAVLVAAGMAAYLLAGRLDLAPLVARRASAALGRPVAIASLHVTPGWWIKVDVGGFRLDNVAGGSRPAMVELGHLTAEVEAVSLLHGPAVVRGLTVEGLSVLLERTAERTANWTFGPRKPKAPEPADRSWFPTLLDARLRGCEVTYRTARGAEFRVRLDNVAVLAAGADRPVQLVMAGAYNGTQVSLTGALQPIAVLRNAAVPYGETLHMASGQTTLDFQGTMTEPFDVDGARGTLTLKAPTAGPILAIAGVASDFQASLDLAGTVERTGDLWRLTDAAGALKGNAITAGSLRLTEGGRGTPDDVAADIAFDRLDLNGLLGGASGRADTDVPLDIDRAPDTLIDARLAARQLIYGGVRAEDATLAATLTPGQVAVKELALTYLGARVTAAGRVEAADKGGRVSADVAVSDADIQRLRQALGFGPVPISGKLDAQVVATSSGATLNAATRAARVSAAVSMTGGSIAREVIEMASTDVRLLFRRSKGVSPVSCLLGVLDMRAGVGTVLPLRIRAADGTIAGNMQFDLYRRRFDLTIASQSASTGFFALDIPVRISGAFANPSVRPARWSAVGRAMLAATDRVGLLPPGVQRFARGNPCLTAGKAGKPGGSR